MIKSRLLLMAMTAGLSSLVCSKPLYVALGQTSLSALSYESGEFVGTHAEVYACVFGRLNREIEISILPVARLEKGLEYGDIDIAMPLGQNEKRDEYAEFALPLLSANYSAVTISSIEDSSDLESHTFAVLNQSSSEQVARSAGLNIQVVPNYKSAIKMVLAERLDGAILPQPILDGMGVNELSGLKVQPIVNSEIGLYVGGEYWDRVELITELNTHIEVCTI